MKYIKISKDLSAKYHQDNKVGYKERLMKDIKVFLKKKKQKSNNMVEKKCKNLSEDEKQKLGDYKRNIIE